MDVVASHCIDSCLVSSASRTNVLNVLLLEMELELDVVEGPTTNGMLETDGAVGTDTEDTVDAEDIGFDGFGTDILCAVKVPRVSFF